MIHAMSTHDSKRRRLTQPPAASIAAIPEDLLASEVFLRLPVEDLLRVKSVCRSWRAAVADPAFVRRHLALARSRSPPTFLVIPREDDPDEASQPEDVCFHRLALDEARNAADVELMFKKASPTGMAGAVLPTHCDGLVALSTFTATGRVCVCNPATGEFVALPPGARGRNGAAALCYDRWRDRYVVVRYFYRWYDEYKDAASGKRKLDYEIGHEAFTLGDSSSSWEPTADPPLAIGPADPVCTRDAVYWCADDDDTLLRFGLRDRAFHVAPCPPGAGSCCGNRTVTGLGGKLCYVACNCWTEPGGYDVWVADDADGRRLEWSLRCHVGFDVFGRAGVGEDALLPVFAAGEDEMVLAADYKQVYRYGAGRVQEVVDLEEEMAQEKPDGTPKSMVYHVVPYVESLVSISARR